MTEFLAMGGYAAFVWSAYGVAAGVMIALLASTLRGLKQRRAVLDALERARGPSRRRAAPTRAAAEQAR